MRFEADTHSHTLASGHAYSTIKEMAAAAEAKGLKALALTEHACRSKKMRRNSPLNGSGSKYNG